MKRWGKSFLILLSSCFCPWSESPAGSVEGKSSSVAWRKAAANDSVSEVLIWQRRPVGYWDFSRMLLCLALGMEELCRSCCAGCKPGGYLLALGWSSLGWVFWPQGCLHCEDGTKQPYFREGLGPGPYLALIILNNLSVCHIIYITLI